jgi:16S rRNA (guanine1516-N2)-methyltransferase
VSLTLYCHPLAQPWALTLAADSIALALQPPEAIRPCLWAAPDHLELHAADPRLGGVWVEATELRRRAADGSMLKRACGALGDKTVLDPMAGWGVDALLLAAAGARVIAIEQEPLLHALGRDLARRSGITGVEFRCGDGRGALAAADSVDLVYLDPMFPAHGKTALPGKRMQVTRAMPGAVADMAPQELLGWIDAARTAARRRVVLKRRLKDPVAGVPDWQIKGRSVRYDVYRGTAA